MKSENDIEEALETSLRLFEKAHELGNVSMAHEYRQEAGLLAWVIDKDFDEVLDDYRERHQ